MPKAREPFSILKMKDLFDECSETLLAAIRKQNPDISADAFDMALRQLVINYGGANIYQPMNGVLASFEEARPTYIEAGDVLVLAYKEFTKSNHENALKLFVAAMEADHIEDLMDAISLNNDKSHVGETEKLESSEDSDDEDTPLYDIVDPDDGEDDSTIDETDEDDNDGDSDSDSDSDEDSDDIRDDEKVESRIKRVVSKLRLHAAEDEDESDAPRSDEENIEEETENKNAPMGGTSSERVSASRLKRAAANRISLLGTDKALEKAREFKTAC